MFKPCWRSLFSVFTVLFFASFPVFSQIGASHPVHFVVKAPGSITAPLSGRLLVFLKAGKGDKAVDSAEFNLAGSTWVGAREVSSLAPGASIEIDPDAEDSAVPTAFSRIPAGDYEVQAVLDVDHSYNYTGRGPGDWISPVVSLAHWTPGEGPEPVLELTGHPEEDPARAAMRAEFEGRVQPGAIEKVELTSAKLTQFWGRPMGIRGWVALPPGYAEHPRETYPTVYFTHGFTGTFASILGSAVVVRTRMEKGTMPPMIWVMLDESCPQGTHEFADSVNDGPWGAALTTEFIPWIEKKYRMDARRDGRFLNGHSSGGWATLQLEVNYPEIFGGTWSTSPDPSDFHDFTGVDLYAANANMYRRADGTAYPLVRMDGKVVATLEQFAKLENVLGPYGGQFGSFDWVFSPRSASGAPMQMFNRATGAVDPTVVAYWQEHYDLAHIVERDWGARGADLTGRIHLLVGTADTFYLDGAAHKFEAVLNRLGAQPHFTYVEGRTHFDLYEVGKDSMGLYDRIAGEMYAVARPKSDWKAKVTER